MQVSRTTLFLPVLMRTDDPQVSAATLAEDFLDELSVAYTPGPPYGRALLTWDDLADLGVPQRELRRRAAANLYEVLDRVAYHGQPPALMLSLDGLESSALLARAFWDDLAESVPGELVVGVPARDVVIFTGEQSGSGVQKVRRAVERVFFAGGPHLLSSDLLVRRQRRWEVFRPAPTGVAAPPAREPAVSPPMRAAAAPDHPVPVSPPVGQPAAAVPASRQVPAPARRWVPRPRWPQSTS